MAKRGIKSRTGSSKTKMSTGASPANCIRLRGVRVNNLKDIDLDIPHGQLLSLCGLSGSGKTSLALDTLFAEGQRRYVECFSPYTRQFLDQMDKPDADQIDGIPPAIAVTASRRSGNARSTVGSVTEAIEYLRLLFAQASEVTCPECQIPVVRSSPQQIVAELRERPPAQRFQIAYPTSWESAENFKSIVSDVRRNGFRRVVINGRTIETDGLGVENFADPAAKQMWVVVDRLKTGELNETRCTESLETAFFYGHGTIVLLTEIGDHPPEKAGLLQEIDGKPYFMESFSNEAICQSCNRQFPRPEVSLFSYNSARGACPQCEGFGAVHFLDLNKIVPDRSKSIAEGAIAPWNSPAYKHELEELTEIADAHGFPLDKPFEELNEEQLALIWKGDRSREFGGLDGFFAWLERRKYKMHLRIFLARWRSYRQCSSCDGSRLNETALSYRFNGMNIAEYSALTIDKLTERIEFAASLASSNFVSPDLRKSLSNKLQYLNDVGVGYLALNRQSRTLSSGERQRVALTRALGSDLVNLLYVLDEPSAGLHPVDVQRVKKQIRKLQQRNNTVVVVDHDPDVIKFADRIIEIGPEAGREGGKIVFDGSVETLCTKSKTVTAQFLNGQRGGSYAEQRRPANRGMLKLFGATGNNLKNVNVDFPLCMLTVVTGVSGSGKSTLVRQTLAPAIRHELGESGDAPLAFSKLQGAGRIDQVAVIDQSALARVSRSNPATYVKAWDEIRKVFASTADAQAKEMKPGHFSFNVQDGRCEHCEGEGYITIDMQFMADVVRTCEQCRGTRFKHEVCQVRYRSHNISDILNMTVNHAFTFFRGHRKVQTRLKLLKDVGLGYVQVGQPVSTLSVGEAQRLKLAAFLGQGGQKRTLFIMDEPTAGLHMADVVRLVDCFDALLDVGHSLIVIEHNRLLLSHADYIIDIGPAAAENGGRVVATGTPEEISKNDQSLTGQFLRPFLEQQNEES